MTTHLFGSPGAAFVTDFDGTVSLTPGVPSETATVLEAGLAAVFVPDDDSTFAPSISFDQFVLPLLVTDDETIHAPARTSSATLTAGLVTDDDAFPVPIIGIPRFLLPALVAADDAIPAPGLVNLWTLLPALVASDDAFHAPAVTTGSVTVRPPLITAADTYPGPFVTLVGVGGGPQQKLKSPPKHQDTDTIYAPMLSQVPGLVVDADVIRAPVVVARADLVPVLVTDADTDAVLAATIVNAYTMRAVFVPHDDSTYSHFLSMIVQPELLANDDELGAADVGWQVIAEFTTDEEHAFSIAEVQAYNELLPEPWMDEEHIDTYPFFVQALSGGVPVLPREGVLRGSIKTKVSLVGSITTRRAA